MAGSPLLSAVSASSFLRVIECQMVVIAQIMHSKPGAMTDIGLMI